MTGEPVTRGWADACEFSCARDRWLVLRCDNQRFLTADTLTGLNPAIGAGYRDHPVPRDSNPPGATDYLNTGRSGPLPPALPGGPL